jgi:nicotinamidase-related amidase
MISPFDFEGAGPVLRSARRITPAIARLKSRAARQRVPVIYVNDMAGRWESDQQAYVARCLRAGQPGRDVVARLAPAPADYFIFKPRHSGFFATALAELLELLRVQEVILTGLTSHQCVLFTGMDAHVREYAVTVPRDCVAAPSPGHTRHALFILRHAMMAHTPLSSTVRFGKGGNR